uniref:Retrovirus-related Pol polyprotein from transposon TNT 1-94 n=1 Tax=Tanacetum cinerariifolium TaxID=118510 RepID=A0A699GWS0_TANCI|nr:retrovirus-related Pol polyprotein from transposon TNT 1-94 [Tanacetum cinerariifolium]
MTVSPLVDSGLAIPVFSPGDDIIACLNKEMAFLTIVASLRFPLTNNQLRTSLYLRNQATIQDGRVTMQQVQGRQGQSYFGTGYISNATSSGGNNASGQTRFVKCYNCQGEGHIARQCTQPKRPRNAAWYKDKAMLAKAQEAGQILDEEQLVFLADPGVQDVLTIIPNNAAFQTEDLDTYDSDCDDILNAKAVIMANFSNYGSDVISEQKPKNVGLSKKAKIVESKNANHSEPNHTWGSNATDIPSSSSLVMTGCPDCSLVSGLRMFKTHDRELLSAHELCVDLISGSRDTSLYKISLDDMLKTSSICLLSKASKTKSWLWHRRLSHLNFSTLNKLAKDCFARGIPRLNFQKDQLYSACTLGKSKKSSHQPKAEGPNQEKLYLLYMDLFGPMRVASINGKRYILVIVDDYSGFTWVKFLKLKDKAPEAIIKCIKNIQVRLNATVRNVRTDNETGFVNQTLHEFYKKY